MTHNIVFLDRGTIAPFVDLRRPDFDHQWTEYDATTPDQVVERLAGATIAINNKVTISGDMIAQLPDLKMIAIAATGYDCIDMAACRERGIVVSNIRGYAVNTVPEHTFALMLALRRQIIGYRADVQAGEWMKAGQFCFFNHQIKDLAGSRLGILGEGSIGQSVAAIGRAFGMEPVFAAHKGVSGLGPLYTPWDEVIETSDVITMHSPLMPATRGMIALPELKAMKDTAILLNTARGGLAVEEDVVTAIEQGMIAGAGFDVVTVEPIPKDHPFMRIIDRPNFILTPHTAWASTEAMQTLSDQMVDNMANFVAGNPSNVV